jgi:hypothetical protein
MKLHGNDPRASRNQLLGDDARTGSDINDEIASADARRIDEATRPTLIELVPPPPPASLGHGTPSPLPLPLPHHVPLPPSVAPIFGGTPLGCTTCDRGAWMTEDARDSRSGSDGRR